MLDLCERLNRAGLVDSDSLAVSVIQDVLADALGFSAVHVDHTMQQLRREKPLDARNGQVVLLRPERLRERERAALAPLPGIPMGMKATKRKSAADLRTNNDVKVIPG